MAKQKVNKSPFMMVDGKPTRDIPVSLKYGFPHVEGGTINIKIDKSEMPDTQKIVKAVRSAISFPIQGPFPRPVSEGETFTRAELNRQGLQVVYKRGHAVVQFKK